MLKSYKYQLKPSKEQEELLEKHFGCVRFVYNLALEATKLAYQTGFNYGTYNLIKELPDLKKDLPWLKEVNSQSLQESILNLDKAFINFYKGRSNYPKFKSKKSRSIFQVPGYVSINFEENKIWIPKLKKVDFYPDKRRFNGKIKICKVFKTPTGKFFISILVDDFKKLPLKNTIKEETTIGIDLGINHFAILSNNEKIINPRFKTKKWGKIKRQQKSLRRKYVQGNEVQSNNYYKQKLKFLKTHEKITNQRKDFLHKLSTLIVKKYDSICIEDLNIKGMITPCKPKTDENGKFLPNGQARKRGLTNSILDAGWGLFTQMVTYKCEWYGKNLIKVNTFYPSSKTCSNCSFYYKNLKEQKTWVCESCNTLHDRDINAAINIKNFGLRTQPLFAKAEH